MISRDTVSICGTHGWASKRCARTRYAETGGHPTHTRYTHTLRECSVFVCKAFSVFPGPSECDLLFGTSPSWTAGEEEVEVYTITIPIIIMLLSERAAQYSQSAASSPWSGPVQPVLYWFT